MNDGPFPFAPRSVDLALLTHAHTDHAGLLPKLVAQGFGGPIVATEATADLLTFMLRDSARIQESENERRNRYLTRKGRDPEPPAFTMKDAEAALERIETVAYETWSEPASGLHARFWNAGHILGSASIEMKFPDAEAGRNLRLLFSGDLGPDEKTFHPEPDAEQGFDYVICESTYGDRERADYTLEGRRSALRAELTEALNRGGNVVIPAFAVERSQELLHDIGVLLTRGEIPNATVFLDSPLASKVTEVFSRHAGSFEDIEVPEQELFRNPRFRIVRDVEESKAINRVRGGAVIISASGMADAGRVQHHLKNNIWRREATVLFVGYQAPGTLGEIIQSGAPEVRIHGRSFKVAAQIRSIGNYSAHADQSELIDWILARRPIVGGLFLNHGEDTARAELKRLLIERGIAAEIIKLPAFDETFELVAGAATSKGRGPSRIDDAELGRDWNNDYAAFILELNNRLEIIADPAERRAVIARARATLDP
jgi:metallo-beta-lactamase family protein